MIDHSVRRMCVTSTDVGPIFGVDGYRDAFDVWTSKHGHAPPFPATPRMLLGKDLEQGIVQAYSRITGKLVEWTDRTMQHPERPWMAASPDGLVYSEGRSLERGVDAKLVFWDQRGKWGAGPDDIPEGIQLQMWWMMAVCNVESWDIAAWVGEDAPRIYEIERNAEAERVVIAKCEEWHRRYIVGNEVPPISGSANATAWLQQAFPRHKRPDMRTATDEEIDLLEEYGHVREVQKEATERRYEMENQIRLAVGDREGLEWPGGKFTWRTTKDKTTVDWETLADGILRTRVTPEERKMLIDLYTTVTPGARRIHFVSKIYKVAESE